MTRQADKTIVKVQRTDPHMKVQYATYEVSCEGATVLQVLEQIYENQDPTLAFRSGCGGSGPARCGACVMEVNDIPVLACGKQAEKEMVIKSHRKFECLKDLVVDFEAESGKD
jgi:succinate dehydrogenase/fumarate reductase-like Fe-S protein